ncbi:hypothetical protein RRG08_058922 [Elysia crispata]|uniref:Uncharacterized protein n=1 Tax=Elysia crispata TaxID=231223 RepID=A0AAE0XRF0_9GAST|nr:hypothetical protein RRG08_058922 [Elysia crispata]
MWFVELYEVCRAIQGESVGSNHLLHDIDRRRKLRSTPYCMQNVELGQRLEGIGPLHWLTLPMGFLM